MQSSQALTLLTGLVGLAAAAPAAVETRQFQAQLHFNGAAATYTISAPTDATLFYTGEILNPPHPSRPPTPLLSSLFPALVLVASARAKALTWTGGARR